MSHFTKKDYVKSFKLKEAKIAVCLQLLENVSCLFTFVRQKSALCTYGEKIQMRLFLVIFFHFFVIYNKVAFFFYVHSCRRELHQTNLEDVEFYILF